MNDPLWLDKDKEFASGTFEMMRQLNQEDRITGGCRAYMLTHIMLKRAHAEIDKLRTWIDGNRRTHVQCEDCWYSCPKSEDGCCNEAMGDECSCGADETNAEIDALLGCETEEK